MRTVHDTVISHGRLWHKPWDDQMAGSINS